MIFLNLSIHEVPHESLEADDMVGGAESVSEWSVEGDVSSGDGWVGEPKN